MNAGEELQNKYQFRKYVRGTVGIIVWDILQLENGKLQIKFLNRVDPKIESIPKKLLDMAAKESGQLPYFLVKYVKKILKK